VKKIDLSDLVCVLLSSHFVCLLLCSLSAVYECLEFGVYGECAKLCMDGVVCSFNGKKRLSNRNSFAKRDESEIINVLNENKMSKSKCQKLIIKCYWWMEVEGADTELGE